jgi:hypothetical protein
MPYRVVETDANFVAKPAQALDIGTDSAVPQNILTTIATFAAGTSHNITEIVCSADTPGRWELHIDATAEFIYRTSKRSFIWQFQALGLLAAETIRVKFFPQCNRATAQADATIYGYPI